MPKVSKIIILFLLFLSSASHILANEGKIIRKIDIKGNNRIDDATIEYYINTTVGEKYSVITIREDIKRIYKIGHFEDVKVEADEHEGGLRLTYIVIEKPAVSSIKIDGNDDVSEEDIKEKITVAKGDVLDKSAVKESIKNIEELYREKGFYFASITAETEKTKNNQSEVIFTIEEKEKIKIKEIKFIGNKNISSRKLRSQMGTSEKGLFSWITGSGVYTKEVLETDILQIESFYRDRGYARVAVYDPEVTIDKEKKSINITISIKEGVQYRVKHIEIKGDDTFSSKALFTRIELKTGDIFNRSLLREDIFRINKLYSQKGYAYTDISPVIKFIDEEQKVDITLEIARGRKFYVGKITIKGNDKTRDRVIRREFRLKEGDIFDSWKLERSRERIFNLSFFEDVKLDVSRGEEDDLLDINVTVEERPTGQFSVSAGYSSVENFVFSTQISLANLLGRGQKLSLTAERSTRRTEFVLDFYEPRVFDREISAGFDVFNKKLDNYNNRSNSYGGGIRLGRSLGEYTWGSVKYRFKYLDIQEVSSSNNFNKEGAVKISSLISTIKRDSRDNFLNPTKGTKVILSGEYAGGPVLGGETFYKLNMETSRYFPLKWKFVGLLHGRIGFAEPYDGLDIIPITERYFLGGPYDLRGFNSRDVGPRDADGPLGGNKALVFNAEIHYPFTDAVRAMIFYDRGNVFGKACDGCDVSLTDDDYSLITMRHSYGFGIRLFTPIGPIGLAYGIKIDRKKGESSGEFHFSIGGSF